MYQEMSNTLTISLKGKATIAIITPPHHHHHPTLITAPTVPEKMIMNQNNRPKVLKYRGSDSF